MGLFDFLKKKTKNESEAVERSMPTTLEGFDPSAVVPPDTRFTQEYQDFLAAQEAAGQNRELSGPADAAVGGAPEEASGTAESCGECGEEEAAAEAPEEGPREYCEVLDDVPEEAAPAEDAPVEVIAPETDDIIGNE